MIFPSEKRRGKRHMFIRSSNQSFAGPDDKKDYAFEAELSLMETEGAKKLASDTTPWSMQAHYRITSQFYFILKTLLRVSYSCLQTPLCTNTHWSKHLHLSQLFSLVFELGLFSRNALKHSEIAICVKFMFSSVSLFLVMLSLMDFNEGWDGGEGGEMQHFLSNTWNYPKPVIGQWAVFF